MPIFDKVKASPFGPLFVTLLVWAGGYLGWEADAELAALLSALAAFAAGWLKTEHAAFQGDVRHGSVNDIDPL